MKPGPEFLDLHQHLWPAEFVEALRRRTSGPRMAGWTLHLDGEPDFEISPTDHDVAARLALDGDAVLLGVSLSSPLGIENLAPAAAAPLLEAWHRGAAALPTPFRSWAAVNLTDPDLDALHRHLTTGFLGLQLPATALATPAALDAIGALLEICQAAGRPVFIHPGPIAARPDTGLLPTWWPAVVDYTAQLTAAWWSWQVAGRQLFPTLRICFAAGAGLAPIHHERFAVRGGGNPRPIDALTFVETSSYGPRAIDALIRVLGIDVIVNGTDRPYAGPVQFGTALGDAAVRAIRFTNPNRLLEGGAP